MKSKNKTGICQTIQTITLSRHKTPYPGSSAKGVPQLDSSPARCRSGNALIHFAPDRSEWDPMTYKAAFVSLTAACAVSVSAAPAALLRCPVTGSFTTATYEDRISETIEVEVDEDQWLSIDIRGPTLDRFVTARSGTSKSGLTTVATNRSTADVWELINDLSRAGNTYTQAVRIDRRTGSFSYSQFGNLPSGRSVQTTASGVCAKQSIERKF